MKLKYLLLLVSCFFLMFISNCTEEDPIEDVSASFTTSQTTIKTGESVTFTDNSAGLPTSWSWSFPGGDPSSSANQNPSITYNIPGVYDVTLTAKRDTETDTETSQNLITVLERLAADFEASKTTISEGDSITFTSKAKGDPTTWSWEFEEGMPSTSSDKNPIITYKTPGVYKVKLTVKKDGETDTKTVESYVTIEDACPYNSDFECADTVSLDNVIKGKLDVSGQANYYYIELAKAGVFEISLTNVPSDIKVRAQIYNSDQEELTNWRSSGNGAALNADKLLKEGGYYVIISGNAVSAGEYDMKLSQDTNDPNEWNNEFETATPITLNTEINGTIRDGGDLDYFVFETTEIGVLEFQVTNIDPDINAYVKLYDESQQEIEEWLGNEGAAVSFKQLLDKGTYYISLTHRYSGDGSETIYSLSLNLNKDDPNEFNNTFATSTPLTLGTDIKGTINSNGDRDFFEFNVTQAGTLVISLTDLDKNVEGELQLYNESQVRVKYKNGGSKGSPMNVEHSVGIGKYYLLVTDYNENHWGSGIYNLKMSLK